MEHDQWYGEERRGGERSALELHEDFKYAMVRANKSMLGIVNQFRKVLQLLADREDELHQKDLQIAILEKELGK